MNAKRRLVVLLLGLMPLSPVTADNGSLAAQLFTGENIGRVLGAGVGTYLGSQIGGGSGTTIATGAGAIIGYEIGGKIGRDWGASNRAQGAYSPSAPAAQLAPLTYQPALEPINAEYIASAASNVRGGPATTYGVVDRLHAGEDVTVVGRVVGTDWHMIAENGVVRGFVYAPLLMPRQPTVAGAQEGIIGQPVDTVAPPATTPARYTL